MDGRTTPRARLSRNLDVKIPDDLLARIDDRVSIEARETPEITRSSWVRRALVRELRRFKVR